MSGGAALDRGKLCQERVWGARVTSRQCGRSAGFGPGGKYCKQHAARHEKVEPTIPLWVIENGSYQTFDAPKKVMARSVGDSTFIDKNGRRGSLRTEWEVFYFSEKEAIEVLLQRIEKHIEHSFKEINRGERARDKLANLLLSIRESEKKK